MKRIESILIKKYKMYPVAKNLNGPRRIVAQNLYMGCTVAMPGDLDYTDKWIVRFWPTVPYFTPGGYTICDLGAMVEERFDSKAKCIKYLKTKESYVFKKLYIYTLETIKDMAKSLDDLEDLDPRNRGGYVEVL